LGILKITEAEAVEILNAFGESLLEESFPQWSGDPRNPSPSRYADAQTYEKWPLKPLRVLPIDEWVAKAAPFKPLKKRLLSDGPYYFVREFLRFNIVPNSWDKSDVQKSALAVLVDFTDTLGDIADAINRLSEFDMRLDLDDRKWGILCHYVSRLGTTRFFEEVHGKKAVDWQSDRWQKFAGSLNHLLGEETANAVNGLLDMTREARQSIPTHQGRGPAPALWRAQFTRSLAHLWRSLYGQLPGSNPDHPFVGFVDAVWQSALSSVGHARPLPSNRISISEQRLDELAGLNWERQVREALAEIRKDAQ
jgi:hypothetical protein